jgi:hypothetical protein
MAEDKGTNSATALSNEEEPSLPPALSEAYEQTNETKKTNELPASNTSKNGGSDFVQWPSDIAIASPAADAEANQMEKDDGGIELVQSKQQVETETASNNDDMSGTTSTNVDHPNTNAEERVVETGAGESSDKNTANQKEEPVAIGDKDESSNALGTAAVDQPPPYSSKRARHPTKDDDDIGNDSIDEEQTEDSDDEQPTSKSDSAAAASMVSSLNETTMDVKSDIVVDQGGGNNDAGKSNNTQSKQQLNKEEKVAVSTVAATAESGSRKTSRRSTRKRKAAS